MKVFIAAPLFSEGERVFNSKVAQKLRAVGFKVWVAQESYELQENLPQEKKRIYECDISALKKSDVIVAILDGIEVDSGVAYELGFAKDLNKPLIGIKTDHRTFSKIEEVNLMLEVSLIRICKTIPEVIETLNQIK